MDRLSDLLASYLAQRGMKDQAAIGPVLSKASAWIRDRLPAHADLLRLISFQDRILVIAADETKASEEMASVSDEIRLYLLESLPDCCIASVRVIEA